MEEFWKTRVEKVWVHKGKVCAAYTFAKGVELWIGV